MGRPIKNTVKYFPHSCTHGKTMFIIESKYGNNGYAFWFKLLEKLGSAENHFIDLRDEIELEYLAAETKFPAEETQNILDLLSRLNAIDRELWKHRIIWCQKFVDNIAEAYRKRKLQGVPERPVFEFPAENTVFLPEENQFPAEDINKLNKTILNDTKQDKTKQDDTQNKNEILCAEIITAWNEIINQKVRITEKRKPHIKKRIQEWKDIETVKSIFLRIKDSKFCMGEGNKGWKASFDWIISNDTNWVKVMEGNFDNREPKTLQDKNQDVLDSWLENKLREEKQDD